MDESEEPTLIEACGVEENLELQHDKFSFIPQSLMEETHQLLIEEQKEFLLEQEKFQKMPYNYMATIAEGLAPLASQRSCNNKSTHIVDIKT